MTLVLGLVVAFSKKIRPALIVTFAVFEGLMVGGISTVFAQAYDGVVTTAILSLGIDIARWYREDGHWDPDRIADWYADLTLRLVRA